MTPLTIKHSSIETLGLGLRLAEPLLVILASLLAYGLRHHTFLMPAPYVGLTLLAAFAYALLAGATHLYGPPSIRSRFLILPRLAWVLALSLSIVIGLLFLLKISSTYSRAWLFGWAIAVTVGLLALRQAASWLVVRQTQQGRWLRRVVILGTGKDARELNKLLSQRSSELKVHGLYTDFSKVMRDASRQKIDDLILAFDVTTIDKPKTLLDRLHQLPVNVHYSLPLPLFGRVTKAGDMPGLPLVLLYRKPIEGYRLVLKRGLDVIGGSFLLVLAIPFILMAALAIKLTSPGPVLFTQQRSGFTGQKFTLFKLRSMKIDALQTDNHGKEKQARRNDARLTPIGKFLRRTSIDELPQLLNVLLGDMSLVGPRPHVPSHDNYYGRAINHYASRHKIRPGLTGWAQINGLRGETKTVGTMTKRVEHDIWYIENWSMALDLRILLLTPLVMLFQKQAY